MRLEQAEKHRLNQSRFIKSLRHSKFGTSLQVFREDGSSKIVNNIYAKNIDLEDLGKSQLRQPKRSGAKDGNKVIVASSSIIDDAAKDASDNQLLAVLHDYLTEMLQNSYGPLIEELFSQILHVQALLEENDRFYLLKLQTFLLEVCRLKAATQHQQLTLQANVGQSSKSKVKVPFKINISQIGVSLQFNSFDFLFSTMYLRVVSTKTPTEQSKTIRDREFHAALKMMIQFLQIIDSMGKCTDNTEEDEKNRKNSFILKSYVFRHEIWKLVVFAFKLFNPDRHALEFL